MTGRDTPGVDPADGHRDVGAGAGPIRILLVEDHAMVAQSLLHLLQLERDFVVVGVVTTGEAALSAVRQLDPDVVLMDYSLPDLDGASATGRILREDRSKKVVMLTGAGSDEVLMAAIEAGCSGYVEKSSDFTELTNAVRLAASGEIVMTPTQLARILPRLASRGKVQTGIGLTRRELEVLELVSVGLSNKAVAARLELKVNTVRNHVQALLSKLEAHSRLEAVAKAGKLGLLNRPSDPLH